MNRRKLARRSALAAKIAARHRYALMVDGANFTTYDVEAAREQRRALALQRTDDYVYILDRSFTPARMVR